MSDVASHAHGGTTEGGENEVTTDFVMPETPPAPPFPPRAPPDSPPIAGPSHRIVTQPTDPPRPPFSTSQPAHPEDETPNTTNEPPGPGSGLAENGPLATHDAPIDVLLHYSVAKRRSARDLKRGSVDFFEHIAPSSARTDNAFSHLRPCERESLSQSNCTSTLAVKMRQGHDGCALESVHEVPGGGHAHQDMCVNNCILSTWS